MPRLSLILDSLSLALRLTVNLISLPLTSQITSSDLYQLFDRQGSLGCNGKSSVHNNNFFSLKLLLSLSLIHHQKKLGRRPVLSFRTLPPHTHGAAWHRCYEFPSTPCFSPYGFCPRLKFFFKKDFYY